MPRALAAPLVIVTLLVSPGTVTAESAESAIRSTLEEYRLAIESRDLGALRHVRPALTPAEMQRFQRAFDQLEHLEVTLTVESMAVNGDQAEVRGVREDLFITKDGQRLRNRAPFRYRLQTSSDRWIILTVD
jgi:hypothetical protein